MKTQHLSRHCEPKGRSNLVFPPKGLADPPRILAEKSRLLRRFAPRNDERGYILVTSSLLMVFLAVLGLALLTRNTVFFQSSERNRNKTIAFNMAEAGLDQAIVQLASDTSYYGTGSYSSMDATGMQGGYSSVVMTHDENQLPFADANHRMIVTYGHAPELPSTVSATSCPTTASTGTRGYECRNIIAYVQIDSSPFEYAVFGDTSVTLNGASGLVNSYNSANGAYGGANIASNGDVAYDGTLTNNNTTINGDIVANPNINCAPGSTGIASSGTINLNGSDELVLEAGTYHYDSISMSGNSSITCNGAVTIYVDGSVTIAGNGIATSGNTPANLMIIATSDAPVSVSGSSNFYGIIYAPDSEVTSDAGGFFGSVISDTFTQNGNGDVHYDEALMDVSGPCTQVDLLSWREVNTSASS